jgi:hypothetical protein
VIGILVQRGLMLEVGTLLDATLIAASSSTKKKKSQARPQHAFQQEE